MHQVGEFSLVKTSDLGACIPQVQCLGTSFIMPTARTDHSGQLGMQKVMGEEWEWQSNHLPKTKNQIRVTNLSGCVTEILALHRMSKIDFPPEFLIRRMHSFPISRPSYWQSWQRNHTTLLWSEHFPGRSWLIRWGELFNGLQIQKGPNTIGNNMAICPESDESPDWKCFGN